MSKVSTTTESNLKTARYKMSGSLVKNNQFTSRDKVMEVRTHAAHIKVKSYNSLIKNNGLSQSWYNNNTSSKSIPNELKLNKSKLQPRNEAKLYDENAPEQNKSRYLTKKEQQKKRTPAYKQSREEQINSDVSTSNSYSKTVKQSVKLKRPAAYKQQRNDEVPESFNNGIIRVTIPHNSIVNPTSNVTQVIRLTEDRENNHLLKVRTFKLVNDQMHGNEQLNANSNTRYSKYNRTRMKLIRANPIEVDNGPNSQQISSYSRYTFSNNTSQSNLNNGRALLQRRIKLNRMQRHTLKEGQINSSLRYTVNSNNSQGTNPNSLKNLSRKHQFNKVASTLNQSTQAVTRNEEDNSFGNKISHQTINQVTKLPAYKATGKQVIGVLDESRKNIEGVLSQKTSITQMITNADGGRKNLNLSSSVRKSIKNIDSNGDLGVDTIVQTKNALLKTEKTLRVTSRAIKNTPRYTKKTVSGLKKSVQAAKWTAKAVAHPIQTSKHLIMATKMAFKTLLNPIMLKGILIFGLIAVILFSCIMAFSGVTSVFAAITYTSEKEDLNDTWKLITQLDADVENEFEHAEEENPGYDYYHFYMLYYPWTSASQFIAYLTAKYDDFKFDEIESVISEIHSELYNIEYNPWIEEREECFISTEGNQSCVKKEIKHLDITLDGQSFAQWVNASGNLNESERERYDTTLEIGGNTMLTEFANPFGNEEWYEDITQRFGYRLVNKEIVFNDGIDISKPAGTEVKSISSGVVEANGEYVKVTKNSNRQTITIKYYGLNNIAVTSGQKIKKNEKIGVIGGTLHITYEIDGEPYNPWFYIEGGYGIDTNVGHNPTLSGPSFTPEIISGSGWAWPAQSTRITSPFGYRVHPITGESKLHQGVDIGRITDNDPIQVMAAGTVSFAGYHVTGGNMVVVDHGNGIKSYYMHLSSMSVKAGDIVDASQNIGVMGNTGGSTGIHLHFEIRVNGKPIDPLYMFK